MATYLSVLLLVNNVDVAVGAVHLLNKTPVLAAHGLKVGVLDDLALVCFRYDKVVHPFYEWNHFVRDAYHL